MSTVNRFRTRRLISHRDTKEDYRLQGGFAVNVNLRIIIIYSHCQYLSRNTNQGKFFLAGEFVDFPVHVTRL